MSSNRKVIPEARSPGDATLLLRRIVALPEHRFWPDEVAIASAEEIELARLIGNRQVTDAHLLTLAIRRGGRLATFDRGIESLVPPGLEAESVLAVLSKKRT